MSWVRLDDNFCDHPKVVGLSDRAFRLHVEALCYCGRFLTDGEVSAQAITYLGTKVRRPERAVAELIAAGLWDRVGKAYRIHNYLRYQPSAVEAGRRRAALVRAGQIGGRQSVQNRRTAETLAAETFRNG